MSDRERWIVYPLLFLSLGASLRSKAMDEFNIGTIHCKRLEAIEVGAHTLAAESIRSESLVTKELGAEALVAKQLGTKETPIQVGLFKELLALDIRCDALNGGMPFMLRPRVDRPKSDSAPGPDKQPNQPAPKSEPAPQEQPE